MLTGIAGPDYLHQNWPKFDKKIHRRRQTTIFATVEAMMQKDTDSTARRQRRQQNWHQHRRALRLTWEQLGHLTRREIKRRYKDTWLGLLWIILTPVIHAMVIAFFLVKIIGLRSPQTPSALLPFIILAGLTVWNFVSRTISQSMNIFISQRGLVKNQPLPLMLLPLSNVAIKLFDFLVETAVLVIIYALVSRNFELNWYISLLALVPFTLALTLFVTSLALLFSILNLFLRDFGHLVSFILAIWFWSSPIFYPAELIPPRFALINLNPMVHFLASFRQIILSGLVDPTKLAKLMGVSLLTAVLVAIIFHYQYRKIYDRV